MADGGVADLSEVLERWREEADLEVALEDLLPPTAGGEADWVSLATAEAAAGVSRSTLRAWYRAGQLRSRLTPGPHGMQRLVPLTDVLARAARSPRGPRPTETAEEAPMPSPPTASAAPSDVVRLAELAVLEARSRAERAEARAEAAEAALAAAIERAAAAEAELRLRREREHPS